MADVIIRTILDGSAKAARELDNLKRNTKNLGEQAEKSSRDWKAFSDSVGRAGKIAAAAGIGILGTLAAVGTASVKVSSDAEEIRSKFQAVFKDSSDAVSAWADDAAVAFNRSSLDLQMYAASLQDTFVPLGFARDQAAQMSTALTELAVDMASFNNVSEADTMRDLQSALVGNHETMRKYGVVIQQTTLDAELLSMGIRGGVAAASEQEKAVARLAVILRSTTDAQGDAARTSDSLANAWRGAEAAMRDASVQIGDAFNPLAKEATELLTGFFRAVSQVPAGTIRMVAGVAAATGALLVLGGTFLFVVAKIPALIAGFAALKVITTGLVGVFTAFTAAALKTAAAVAFNVVVWGTLGAAAVLLVRQWEAVITIFDGVGKTIRAVGALIYNTMTKGPSEAMRIFMTDMQDAAKTVETGKKAFVDGFEKDIGNAVDVMADKFGDARESVNAFTAQFGQSDAQVNKFKSTLEGLDPAAILGGKSFNLNNLAAGDGIKVKLDPDIEAMQKAIDESPPLSFELIERGSQDAIFEEAMQTRSDALANTLDHDGELWAQYWESRREEMSEFTAISQEAFDSFSSGIGDAVGQAVVFGEDFGKSMKKLFQNIAASIISSLVKILVQRTIMAGIMKLLNISEGSSRMGTLFAETYAGAYAATAAIPLIGPIIAPGVAGAALAAVSAGSAGAAATGAGVGAAAGSAAGGFDFIPDTGTFKLHKGEKVLTRKQNRDLDKFLTMNLGGGSGPTVTNQIGFYGPVFADEITIDEMAEMLTKRIGRN